MKAVFISDLHLSPHTIANNQLFLTKIKIWQKQIDCLYILGDFFDYWLGDDDVNDFTTTIKQALYDFTQNKPAFFIKGNHDFTIAKRFSRETGIKILPDLTVIDLDENNRVLLSHGDIFCTLDLNYQKLKKILQHPLTLFFAQLLPLSLRYKIKQKLSSKSQTSYNSQTTEIYQVVEQTIITHLKKYKVTKVIHGHTHNPGIYQLKADNNANYLRYELADWVDRPAGSYLYFDFGKFYFVDL